MTFYGGYYYEYYYLYIFTIHFLFSFTQSYLLNFVLSINHCQFLFVCLFIVVVDTFVFCLWSLLVSLCLFRVWISISVSSFCGCYWCFYTHLLVPLSYFKQLLMSCYSGLAVVLGLFACFWLLLVPLLFPWSLLGLFSLCVIVVSPFSSQCLYP